MILKAKFESKFFIDLYKIVKNYGSVWVMEDGNIYRSERQALQRQEDKQKLAMVNKESKKFLRFARINFNGFPFTSNDLEENRKKINELFEKSERMERSKSDPFEFDKPLEVTMSDEDALRELSQSSTSTEKVQTITINGNDYELSAVKSGLKEIDPKFKLNSSLTTTEAFVKALDEGVIEQLISIIS